VFDPYRSEAEFALLAVRTAASLCRRIQEEMVSPAMEKSDRSPVTVADFVSQAIVARMLQEAFPDDPLVAEEDSAELRVPAQAQTQRVSCAATNTSWRWRWLKRARSYLARWDAPT